MSAYDKDFHKRVCAALKELTDEIEEAFGERMHSYSVTTIDGEMYCYLYLESQTDRLIRTILRQSESPDYNLSFPTAREMIHDIQAFRANGFKLPDEDCEGK